jgi:hypothetical protein
MQPSAPSRLKIGTDYAEMVIGSLQAGRARYTINGEPVDLDVTIPADLAASWFWSGPCLVWKSSGRVGISIDANTFGVQACFEKARWFEAQERKHEPVIMQMEMF